MGRRGKERSEMKLKLLWNLLIYGVDGKGPASAPTAIKFSGLSRSTAYTYVNQLIAEKAVRQIGKSPAVYEATPSGLRYKAEMGINSLRPENKSGHKSGQPPCGGGRDTVSQARAVDATPSTSPIDKVDEATNEAKAGPGPGSEQQQGQAGKTAPEAKAGATAGPEAPAQQQPASAGRAGHEAGGAPHEEDVRPAPPVPLDHPARVHHRVVKVAIVAPADRRPQLDLLQWGPMVQDSHGRDWYRKCQVLFDDIGVVLLEEFPRATIRFWLPDYTATDRARLEACVDDAVHQAQRIVNWLQRNYGYKLGLPEFQDAEVAFPLPDIGGSFQGYIRIRADDGTTIVIDQSKGWAELEILIRASHKSEDLRKLLAWANAPTLLTVIQGQVLELQQRLPHEVRAGAGAAVQAAIPKIAEAVKASLIPEVIASIQEAIKGPEFQGQLRDQVRKATSEVLAYQPPAGPDDNKGYG